MGGTNRQAIISPPAHMVKKKMCSATGRTNMRYIVQNRTRAWSWTWNEELNENSKKVAYIFVWRQREEIDLRMFVLFSEKKVPVYIWDMDNCCNTMEISLYF